jgi:hypothetical protein
VVEHLTEQQQQPYLATDMAAHAPGSIDRAAVQALIAATAPPASSPVYAVDASVWPRCAAEASPDRGYYYHPSRHSAAQPIVAGLA